jgi:hypothetical protein
MPTTICAKLKLFVLMTLPLCAPVCIISTAPNGFTEKPSIDSPFIQVSFSNIDSSLNLYSLGFSSSSIIALEFIHILKG